MKKIALVFVIFTSILNPQNKWQKLNGPEGGVMQGIISQGDTILAGTVDNAMVYFSTDRGENWHKSISKIIGRFSDFIFTDDNAVIAANPYNGLFKSFDLKNWTKLIQNSFWSVGNDGQGKLYAGTDNGYIISSSDNGSTWGTELIIGGRISSFLETSYHKFIAGGDGKVLIKNLNNSVWNAITTSNPNEHSLFSDDSGHLYAGTGNGIFISTDSGLTWIKQHPGTFFNGEYMLDAEFNSRVIGAFGDETNWFGQGWGAAVSDDQGVTWRWSQTGLPPKISGGRIAKSGIDTYMSTWGSGVYKSTDYGESWFAVNKGLTAANTYDIHFDSEGTLYSASWGLGLSRSTDNGENWEVINNGVSNVYFYSIISDNIGNMFAGSERGLFRSTDKGNTWGWISSIFAYRLNKDIEGRIYALNFNGGIYRTSDGGNLWVRIDNGFTYSQTRALTVDIEGRIYAGTFGGMIYVSEDDGVSWRKLYQSSSSNQYMFISRIAIADNGYIFATSNEEGVLRSTDNGENWQKMNHGLGWLNTGPLEVHKEKIYTATTEKKIYMSENYGEDWINVSDNMYLCAFRHILSYDNNLYLATDESVWKSNPDSLTSVTEDEIKPKDYFLSQNYPNPFNPSTTIKYSLPQTGRVTLSIYDLIGREVIKLINEEKPAGEYETQWNASSHPSGVYFMRMQAGEFGETRKIVLVK
jgi:photosystem II stability/assembly factor-like uncharacterized protein